MRCTTINNFFRYPINCKIQQVMILLTGLAFIYVPRYSRAKYNLNGRDNEIDAMKVTVEKGISCKFRPIG